MTIEELYDGRDATGLAEAVRDGSVSAREVLELASSRMDERDPAVNAIVADNREAAFRDVAAGLPEGPLTGVPFVVKDLKTFVAGLPNRNGSRLPAGEPARADSELVARYRRAGAVVVGLTNTPEWGLNASTEPLANGPTRNPHDPSRSAGGSSGGTAAAVAAGIVPFGHGNDGGGSIRIPASACGLVGLKPSRGRTPAFPRRSAFSYPLGVNHVLTRSVRDSALLLDIGAGPVPGDPFVITAPQRSSVECLRAPVELLRVAFSCTTPAGDPVHPDCAAVVERTAKLLAELGHEVVEDAPDYPLDALLTIMRTTMSGALAVDVDECLARLGRDLTDDDLEPFTRLMYDMGKQLTGTEVLQALQEVERTAHTLGRFFGTHDLLLTATMAEPVPPLGLLDTTSIEAMYEHAGHYSALTSPFNATGQPAISLPLGRDAGGLPAGVQLVAAFGREDLLLRTAAQLEEAEPWDITPVGPARSA